MNVMMSSALWVPLCLLVSAVFSWKLVNRLLPPKPTSEDWEKHDKAWAKYYAEKERSK